MPVEKDEELRRILQESRTIAVVGASGSEEKDANAVPAYLQRHGFRILPVNPSRDEILGVAAYPSLEAVDEEIDVVVVFRPAEETPDVARAAVAAGAKVLWLQLGIENDEAARIAEEGGLQVVMDACMKQNHERLFSL